MKTTTTLHLTVSRDGWISLWDTAGMDGHGTNVELLLTSEQEAEIARAMKASITDIGDGHVLGPYIDLRK